MIPPIANLGVVSARKQGYEQFLNGPKMALKLPLATKGSFFFSHFKKSCKRTETSHENNEKKLNKFVLFGLNLYTQQHNLF